MSAALPTTTGFYTEGVFNRPSSADPLSYGGSTYSRYLRPLHKTVSLTVKSKVFIVSLVSVLFLLSSNPATIPYAVALGAIYAVYRMVVGRSFTHVVKEKVKVIFPSIAHGYAKSAVVFKSFVVWVVAPAFDARPNFIFRRAGKAVRHLLMTTRLDSLFLKTSTGLRGPISQGRSESDGGVSARTSAKPIDGWVFGSFAFARVNCRQAAKHLSAYIFRMLGKGYFFRSAQYFNPQICVTSLIGGSESSTTIKNKEVSNGTI